MGDFNIPFSVLDRTIRQKMSKTIEYLNSLITKFVKIFICRRLLPTIVERASF